MTTKITEMTTRRFGNTVYSKHVSSPVLTSIGELTSPLGNGRPTRSPSWNFISLRRLLALMSIKCHLISSLLLNHHLIPDKKSSIQRSLQQKVFFLFIYFFIFFLHRKYHRRYKIYVIPDIRVYMFLLMMGLCRELIWSFGCLSTVCIIAVK